MVTEENISTEEEAAFLKLVEEGFSLYSDYRVSVSRVLPGFSDFNRKYRIAVTHYKGRRGLFWFVKAFIRGGWVTGIEFDANPEKIRETLSSGVGSPLMQDFVERLTKRI